MTGPIGQPDEYDLSRLVEVIIADPAVQAAGDQFRAARRGPPPGQDPATFARRQDAAIGACVRAVLRRLHAEAPGMLTRDVLDEAARYFEPPHETPPPGEVS
jgi:hypothetical protein